MKIRTGFVSNSSSSSFIIALDRKPETVAETKELLFRNDEFFPEPYPENTDDGRPTMEVAARVFADLKNLNPLTQEEALEELQSGQFPTNYLSENDIRHIAEGPDGKTDFDKWNEIMAREAKSTLKTFLNRHRNKQLFVVEYSDNEGEGHLEHGDLFAIVPHIKISKH